MAKKQKVNKTQAVKEYLKANPTAKNQAVVEAMAKKGITLTANYVATIKTQIKKARTAKKAAVAKPVAAVPASPATAEPEKNGKTAATVTLEHVKAVALTVKALGGSARLNELLGLIKEVGGVKKFKDLLEAIVGHRNRRNPVLELPAIPRSHPSPGIDARAFSFDLQASDQIQSSYPAPSSAPNTPPNASESISDRL